MMTFDKKNMLGILLIVLFYYECFQDFRRDQMRLVNIPQIIHTMTTERVVNNSILIGLYRSDS